MKGLAQPLELPNMRMLCQRLSGLPAVDVFIEIEREWATLKERIELPGKGSVAIAVGSRGISNLAEVVRTVVMKLRKAGCEPFIVPAMGSHGGATAEGQVEVLSARGITEQSVGAPVRATMDVTPIGEVDGIPLFMDRVVVFLKGNHHRKRGEAELALEFRAATPAQLDDLERSVLGLAQVVGQRFGLRGSQRGVWAR